MCGVTIVSEADMSRIAAFRAAPGVPTQSPFGPDDQIGMLNMVTEESVQAVLTNLDSGKVFDLSVDLFMGMPSYSEAGDVPFQIWLSHTPRGSVIDDALSVGKVRNEYASYSGDSILMYTHCGTHVDTLNHWGYGGSLWNGFADQDYLGSRHWKVAGADVHPPVIARGVLIDVPRALGMQRLPESHGISPDELIDALRQQRSVLHVGDVVLVRTGHMTLWPDAHRYLTAIPGLTLPAAEFLAKAGAIMIGADTATVEHTPSALEQPSSSPVHTYLLAECGVCLLENAYLEELANAHVYEFGYLGAGLRIRGATAAPIRPLAIPLRRGA